MGEFAILRMQHECADTAAKEELLSSPWVLIGAQLKLSFKVECNQMLRSRFWGILLALPFAFALPSSAADWKDSDCRKDKDDSGNRVEVCRDKESIGIFWEDGSFVNGWCDDREYEIDYKGLSKTEAVSWVEYYCG